MKLSPNGLNQFRTTMLLINQHETSLQALKNHLSSIVREETGVDITKGQWSLDPDTGKLTPQPAPDHPTTEEGQDTGGDA